MSKPWVVVDFESCSAANLKRTGAYRYWADPTTEALCLGWKTSTSRRGIWWRGDPCPFPDKVFDEYMFVAHNAAFERNGWEWMTRELGWRPVPLQQWHDTQARALQLALPASLENLLKALGMPVEKDKAGTKEVLRFSRPDRKTGMLPPLDEAAKARITTYCLDGDVEQQWAVHRRLGWLPDHERRIWELSQEVNDRGIRLDMDFVRAAQKIVDEASKPLAAEFRELTGVNVGQRDKIIAWCREQGVELPNMTKATLAEILGDVEDDVEDEDLGGDPETHEHIELPPNVERALKIRQLIGSASIKKLGAMRECVGYDSRARGLMVYHGTTPGRQTAKLLQPHNFPKPTVESVMELEDHTQLIRLIKLGDWQLLEDCYGPAVETIVSSLRHAICAEDGNEFFAGDYSGIQARTVLALAGQTDKAAYMASGVDVYVDMACDIWKELPRPDWAAGKETFKPQVDAFKKAYPWQRGTGKNSVLGLGFQMGAPTFQIKYAKDEALEFCQGVVDAYRKDWAPCVPMLWKGLQWAAIDTVWEGTPHESHGIVYFLRDNTLVAHLANGSEISYQMPQKTRREPPWSTPEKPVHLRGFSYRVQKMGRWITRDAFGGQLTENIVMKIEREIMESAKQRLRAQGFLQVLEVHDENITEQLRGRDLDEFKQIMEDVDDWVKAIGIPVAVDVWKGPVYKK
jgi:DNA polymerase bacteriophage-type